MAFLIYLDAGHGYNTPGKRTPDGIREWYLNDKVRDYCAAYLSKYDCKVKFTDDTTGKTDVALATRRSTYMNAKASVFVSIHHNAYTSKWNNATGVEVFVDRNYTTKDMNLAKAIYKYLPSAVGLKGRGIKEENWAVINQNTIPAVLVEGGFMDSTIDHPVVTSSKGQKAYGEAVAKGLVDFLGLKKKPVATTTSTSKALFKVGDIVRFDGKSNCYASSTGGKEGSVPPAGEYKVTHYSEKGKYPVHIGSYGWVPAANCTVKGSTKTFLIKVANVSKGDVLNIRAVPGDTSSKIMGKLAYNDPNKYTIVETKIVKGATWGLLKSGATNRNKWINLKYTVKV